MPVDLSLFGPIKLNIKSFSDFSKLGYPKLKSLDVSVGYGVEGHQKSINFEVKANLLKLGCLGIALLPFACFGAGLVVANLK